MQRIISFCLVATVCLSLCAPVFAANDNAVDTTVNVTISPHEENMKTAKDVINEYYGEVDRSDVSLIGDVIEADNFGGLYLDDEGNLVVNVINDVPQMTQETYSFLENEIRFLQVKYSLSELEYVADLLVPYMAEFSILLLDANDMTNKVDICLSDFSDKNIEAIITFLESVYLKENLVDMLNFIDRTGAYNSCEAPRADEVVLISEANQEENSEQVDSLAQVLATTHLAPGAQILVDGYSYTLGPQNPHDTSFFYTAGHGVTVGASVSTVINGISKTIGTITGKQFSGSSDSSHITLASGVDQASLLNYSMANPIVGTSVKMVGAVSGAQPGTVSNVNAKVPYDGVTLTNMVVVNYRCAGGDSGAPVFNNYSSSGTLSDITTCYGVHSGGLFTGTGENKVWAGESYFTKYENLLWTSPIAP